LSPIKKRKAHRLILLKERMVSQKKSSRSLEIEEKEDFVGGRLNEGKPKKKFSEKDQGGRDEGTGHRAQREGKESEIVPELWRGGNSRF